MELLLEHGADATKSRDAGITACGAALIAGHGEIVEILLQATGGVRVCGETGVSALWHQVHHCHFCTPSLHTLTELVGVGVVLGGCGWSHSSPVG